MKSRRLIFKRAVKKIFRRPAARHAAAAVLLVILLLSVRWYNLLLRGQVETPALFAAGTAAGKAIDEAAKNCFENEDGQLIAVSADGGYRVDAEKLSVIRERFTEELAGLLDKKSVIKNTVPIGSLTGNQFLSGHGPRIRTKTYARYKITCETKSSFQSAGINQTLFSVKLDVTVDCSLLFPDGEKTVTVRDEIILGETVIPGAVPLGHSS